MSPECHAQPPPTYSSLTPARAQRVTRTAPCLNVLTTWAMAPGQKRIRHMATHTPPSHITTTHRTSTNSPTPESTSLTNLPYFACPYSPLHCTPHTSTSPCLSSCPTLNPCPTSHHTLTAHTHHHSLTYLYAYLTCSVLKLPDPMSKMCINPSYM